MQNSKPWLRFYDHVPASLSYPRLTIYQALERSSLLHLTAGAIQFAGKTWSYGQLLTQIETCAQSLSELGVNRDDRVLVCLPNIPHAPIIFYALNKIGAVACMVHPLSTPSEIEHYLIESQSKWALALDLISYKFSEIINKNQVNKLIICKIPDYLSFVSKIGYCLVRQRKIKSISKNNRIINWCEMMRAVNSSIKTNQAHSDEKNSNSENPDKCAVILFSGGTTNMPKGIELSSMNFNCLAWQILAQYPMEPNKDATLSVLPVFHGFGLGVSIHTVLLGGGKCLLAPKFEPSSIAKLIRKYHPSFIAGVPTLYAALIRNRDFLKTDLSCLKAAVSGGDKLPPSIKQQFDALVESQNGLVKLREGYGLTETVTACMLMPEKHYRQGSMGIPFPDMEAAIFDEQTLLECPSGKEGEICIRGPTVMLGYLNDSRQTSHALRRHPDGKIWLHTGDWGKMDEDGFFYYLHRIKRMIKVSGICVFPARVEELINSHPEVECSCVIGIPDELQMRSLKAFVVPRNNMTMNKILAEELIDYCKKHLLPHSCPKTIEFRDELPKTLIGKIDYKVLENEELSQIHHGARSSLER